MPAFAPRLLQVASGIPQEFDPVSFAGRMDELTLEHFVVGQPELMGERLLVLGHQLAEFEEDRDRLDILAVDASGELVLIELKVSEDFRVTDLQALAYAGAYATREPVELAETLRRHMERWPDECARRESSGNGATSATAPPSGETAPASSLETAKAEIVAFLRLEDFGEWQPSQHVRIKLVAPQFPRRVLKTVKWLGDVYDMPVEAITVRLFEPDDGHHYLAFERVLPLAGDEEFDLTVRSREDRQREANTSRRPAVLPALVGAGALQDGQELWLVREAVRNEYRSRYDPDHIAFRARVHAPAGATPLLAWRPRQDADEELLRPSLVMWRIYEEVMPDWTGGDFATPVGPSFKLGRDGPTLEALAVEVGVW